jgi:hypothetical protein
MEQIDLEAAAGQRRLKYFAEIEARRRQTDGDGADPRNDHDPVGCGS